MKVVTDYLINIDDTSALIKDITVNGGVVMKDFDMQSVKYLISYNNCTGDFLYYQHMGVQSISYKWIKDCIKQQRILNTSDYVTKFHFPCNQ